MSITILVYVILGGMGNLRGSILATIVLYALPGAASWILHIPYADLCNRYDRNDAFQLGSCMHRDFRSRIVEKIKGHGKEKEAA